MGLCKSGEILGIFHQLDPNFQTLRLEETHPEYLLQGSYHIMVTHHRDHNDDDDDDANDSSS